MNDKIVIKLNNSKYEYTFDKGTQTIKRNGEEWRNETGDNFLLALAQRVNDLEWELESKLAEVLYVIENVVSKNPTTCDSRLIHLLNKYEETH